MLRHNSYFEGSVQSIGFVRHGLRATVGVIAEGEFRFNTELAERMTVISGCLRARIGDADWHQYPAGSAFEIAAHSGFDVQAVGGPAAYLCEFLGA